jgi:hypothetical protein
VPEFEPRAPLTRIAIWGLTGLLVFFGGTLAVFADDWPPLLPEDLAMTAEPKAPGAPALFLYRQVDRDDSGPTETIYERIKILTDEGRKFADVEIPFDKSSESVYGIQARTVRPDGASVKFDGAIYDKPIAQARGVKWLAKTFTLPDVQVGSIIEYRYRHQYRFGYVFDSHWLLSADLYTKYAKFSLAPYRGFVLRFSWPNGLPPGTDAPKDERGRIRLEAHDVPAFVTEEFMPPENETKFRVDFIYVADSALEPEKDPEVFWKKYGKRMYHVVDGFTDHRRAMTDAVASIVEPGDTPDIKLHKLYERTQRIRNLSFERPRSEQEVDREHLKTINDVEELWKQGYGDGNQITWLFLALVRAAGIEADPVIVSTRDVHFFNFRVQNPADLNSNVVLVTLNGRQSFLDPGTAFAPFGMLPWSETGVRGRRLDKDGGSWVVTPVPDPDQSRIERTAKLKLGTDGTLEGTVTVTYTGQEALWRRFEERNEDDVARKQFLEDEIKADVPTGISAELTNQPDWQTAADTLIAVYDFKAPGWVAAAGQRALMPAGLFGALDTRSFQHQTRVHGLYFDFPHKSADDLSITLPANWQLKSMPHPVRENRRIFDYACSGSLDEGELRLKRGLTVGTLYVSAADYGTVQDFFQIVRSGDQDQIVLAAKAAGKTGAQ